MSRFSARILFPDLGDISLTLACLPAAVPPRTSLCTRDRPESAAVGRVPASDRPISSKVGTISIREFLTAKTTAAKKRSSRPWASVRVGMTMMVSFQTRYGKLARIADFAVLAVSRRQPLPKPPKPNQPYGGMELIELR